MNKLFFLFGTIGFLSVSCSTSTEDYEKAASELCNCMNESTYDVEQSSEISVNMGVCLLGATVDLKDPRMVEQLEDECPEIKQAFVDFVERLEVK